MSNPNKSEEPEHEPIAPEQRTVVGDVVKALRQGLNFVFIASYFLMWDKKNWLRDRMKLTSWAVISLSTALLIVKFLIESESVLGLVTASTPIPIPHLPIFIILPFLLYLLYHDIKESQKPAHEYRFARRVGQFMLGRPDPLPEGKPDIEGGIQRALQIFPKIFEVELPDWLAKRMNGPASHGVFQLMGWAYKISKRRRFRFYMCSFYPLNPDALGTKVFYVSEGVSDPCYNIKLVKGEGVAGRVAEDQIVRYVPRLFLPFCRRGSWSPLLFFPHAVLRTFDEKKNPTANEKKNPTATKRDGPFILSSRGLDLFAFKPFSQRNIPFRSIVSVPVKSTKQVFGVMNFDFGRYDPLDVADIAMCSAFGLLLGDEIERLLGGISS